MRKRKRTATIVDTPKENVPTTTSASAIAEKHDPVGEYGPRPNAPSKCGQPDRDKISNGICKSQEAVNLKPSASNAGGAATRIVNSLPPEIWQLIGQKILHPETLLSLVAVSQAFRSIFTPLLYARRIINLEYFSKPLTETPLPPYLEYVQDFRINLFEFRPAGAQYSKERNDEFASWITKALKSMRCLRSFSWRDESCEDSFDPALILRNPDLLVSLKSIRTLRKIFIQFGPLICDPIAVHKCQIPLEGFRNLFSLELYDLYRDHDRLVKEIGNALCDSPFLKKLGLGFACEWAEEDEAIFFGAPGRSPDFLERLCEFYGSISKKGPLALETLRLGFGIYLDEPSKPSKSHYLTKLLNIRSLKVLHLYNGLVNSDLDDEDSFYKAIDWTPFTAGECKSLRQLAVTRLRQDVTRWLSKDGACVQELIVMDHYNLNDKGLNEFSKLPLQLNMIWTREWHPWRRLTYNDEDDWTDTDESVSDWTDIDSSDESDLDADSDESNSDLDSDISNAQLTDLNPSQLAPLISTSAQSQPNPLISTASNSRKQLLTVLDLLPNGGSHLTRLSISLDFETQWLKFSSHLKTLTCLTQLRLNARMPGGEYLTLATSAKIENAVIAQRFAQIICSLCPTLQYIMIGHGHDLAWEVLTPSAEWMEYRRRSKAPVSLRLLELDELLEIELFAYTEFPEQSGLAGLQRDRLEKGDPDPSTKELSVLLAERGISPLTRVV